MRVRVVGALLVVLAFVVTPLSTPGARAQTTRTKVAALVLQSQTPWVGRGGTFQVRIAAPPAVSDDPSDLQFAVSIHPTSPSRSPGSKTIIWRTTAGSRKASC